MVSKLQFECMAITPGAVNGFPVAIAAARAGALGVVNLELAKDFPGALRQVVEATTGDNGKIGLKLSGTACKDWADSLDTLPPAAITTVILSCVPPDLVATQLSLIRGFERRVIQEVGDLDADRCGHHNGNGGFDGNPHQYRHGIDNGYGYQSRKQCRYK
jgi:hypothetical protein